MSGTKAVGIDLGTTYSSVGFLRTHVEVVENQTGKRITPSMVAFTEDEVLVGEAAKRQATVNTEHTVFQTKRLIGRRYDDAIIKNDIKQWPFKVFGDNGAPKIKVQYKAKEVILAPEQVAAMILKEMMRIANERFGEEIRDAVITIPAYFNDSQRQATIDAGKIAGLNVLSIINEPTAAALAYGFDKKEGLTQTVLVYDFGGGTFDVAILSIKGKQFEVKAVGGDSHLGGSDLDSKVFDHFLKLIEEKFQKDFSNNQRARGRIMAACKQAKIALSERTHTHVTIDSLINGEDFIERFTRNRFEELCSDLFERTIKHVVSVLQDARLDKRDIDEVILVGGSSRIPKIQQLLTKFFNGKKLNQTINPDEAVCYGAAIMAAMAVGDDKVQGISFSDVVPANLGIANARGEMVTFIERNTRIPVTVEYSNWKVTSSASSDVVEVYEGDRGLAINNQLIGSFTFHHGQALKVTFTFRVDANGILHVSAENTASPHVKFGTTITGNRGRLSEEEIERLVMETQAFYGESPEETVALRDKLESFCIHQKEIVSKAYDSGFCSMSDRESVHSGCEYVMLWLDYNKDIAEEEYRMKLEEISSKCSPIVEKFRVDVNTTS